MTALALLLVGTGGLLVYAGARGEDVRELVVAVFTGKTASAPPSAQTSKAAAKFVEAW